jgi:hypothetical protein
MTTVRSEAARRRAQVGILAVCAGLVSGAANGQIMNPADAQRAPAAGEGSAPAMHLGSWRMPAVTVVGQPAAEQREEDRIGEDEQPRWTAHRRFPNTRIYVLPQGQFEFEFWSRADVPDDGPTTMQNMYEVEMGLGHRVQLDLYVVSRNEGEGETFLDQKFEVRYALADWGVIWANPTLYLEYVLRDQKQDKVEAKLLVGDELAPRWHWGVNGVFEAETGGDQEREYGLTLGLSYTVLDERLAVGVEARGNMTDAKGSRGDYEEQALVGPSVQFRPIPNMHVDLAPLVGLTDESPNLQNWVNVGWEF